MDNVPEDPTHNTPTSRDGDDDPMRINLDTPGVYVVRHKDEQGVYIEHIGVGTRAVADGTAQEVATRYVESNLSHYYAPDQPPLERRLTTLTSGEFQPQVGSLYLADVQGITGPPQTVVVSYTQTINGLPVWEAGLAVLVSQQDDSAKSWRVVSGQSTLRTIQPLSDITPEQVQIGPNSLKPDHLAFLLGLDPARSMPRINRQNRLFYYQYNPQARVGWDTTGHAPTDTPPDAPARPDPPYDPLAPVSADESEVRIRGDKDEPFGDEPFDFRQPSLPLPPLPSDEDSKLIESGVYYPVLEVLFTVPPPDPLDVQIAVHWRALIEVRKGMVLYARSALSGCFGQIFPATDGGNLQDDNTPKGLIYPADPMTLIGHDPFAPSRPLPTDPTLDPQPTPIGLGPLTPPVGGTPQALKGAWVALDNPDTPDIAPPPPLNPLLDFSYLPCARADFFTSVNAYYHCTSMFRMMDQLGMLNDFFAPNNPIMVDAQAGGSGAGAFAMGDETLTHLQRIAFARARPLTRAASLNIGSAVDIRVALHEFCHGLLWAKVHRANLGFAHSAGDSLAAILNDPCTQLSGNARYETFPWIGSQNPGLRWTSPRLHGTAARSRAQGWGWTGARFNTEQGSPSPENHYDREQILSTTLFRIYEAIGGAPYNTIAQRRAAAWSMAYLIIRAIGTLPSADHVPTHSPDEFRGALIEADRSKLLNQPAGFGAVPGGTLNKVIRWSFVAQGLAPPVRDLYIGAARNSYDYIIQQGNYQELQDVWNLQADNGGSTHEAPVPDQQNFVYVKVRNGGTQAASGVVRGYYQPLAAAPVWGGAASWTALEPAAGVPVGPINPGDAVRTTQALTWTPPPPGGWRLLIVVSSVDDPSNIDNPGPSAAYPCANGPTPLARLVPFDNNIALREV